MLYAVLFVQILQYVLNQVCSYFSLPLPCFVQHPKHRYQQQYF